MATASRNYIILFLHLISFVFEGDCAQCRETELRRCVEVAKPLLQDKYVFPNTTEDVDHICTILFPQTWSKFVQCIEEYSDSCLNQQQRGELNRAVGDSINSVHKLCTNQDYRDDYLSHSVCLKSKATEEEFCGSYYSSLVSLITGESTSNHLTLCCSHISFKECVAAETESCPCTGDSCANQSPNSFAKAILEKALGFLLKQCDSYRPSSADCPLYERKQEKLPRIEEDSIPEESRYEGGAYFPSGTPQRDQRLDDLPPLQPIPQQVDSAFEAREEAVEQDIVQDLDIADLLSNSNIVQPTTYRPEEPSSPTPQENERHQPWVPPADLASFDDIFSNAVDSTRAAELLRSSAKSINNCLLFSLAFLFVHMLL